MASLQCIALEHRPGNLVQGNTIAKYSTEFPNSKTTQIDEVRLSLKSTLSIRTFSSRDTSNRHYQDSNKFICRNNYTLKSHYLKLSRADFETAQLWNDMNTSLLAWLHINGARHIVYLEVQNWGWSHSEKHRFSTTCSSLQTEVLRCTSNNFWQFLRHLSHTLSGENNRYKHDTRRKVHNTKWTFFHKWSEPIQMIDRTKYNMLIIVP